MPAALIWLGEERQGKGALPAGDTVDRFAGADERQDPSPISPPRRAVDTQERATGLTPRRGATSVNEILMKQFPNATKPFWRFRANVLKRSTCTPLPNDAPKTARLGVEQGTINV